MCNIQNDVVVTESSHLTWLTKLMISTILSYYVYKEIKTHLVWQKQTVSK